MRKCERKRVFELIDSLSDVNTEMKRLLDITDNNDEIINLLADCQEFVVAIVDYINSIMDEEISSIKLFETYYELLFKLSSEPTKANFKMLKRKLYSIKSSLNDELKVDRIEVVFFPYKASMMDSLKSIWQTAINDPRCDVYVCPIPYYDKNPDGSFGEMHYEGDLFPENILITDWKEYDVEARNPDIIYIHNPYDANNFVTSIHPNYYSFHLKKNTDLLVYVPYFVIADNLPEHFGYSSGVLHSDKIVVQSENIRQMYIDSFRKFENSNNCVGKYGDFYEKFIALGSPKVDCVLNIDKQDYSLPQQWLKMIGKPCGSNKKIVLYNTSVTQILQDSKMFLKKLNAVIKVFDGNDDIILWWRPHPLSDITFSSMRKTFVKEYESIVEEFKNQKYGIYDDTSDLYRAIEWSDAYYGDGGSSVALIYGYTLKPILSSYSLNILPDSRSNCDFDTELDYAINCLNKFMLSEPILTDNGQTYKPYCVNKDSLYRYESVKDKALSFTILSVMFFNEKTTMSLPGFISYVGNYKDHERTEAWFSLVKAAYDKFIFSNNKEYGKEIYYTMKRCLEL